MEFFDEIDDNIDTHLDILKSFQGYLSDIIVSVEENKTYTDTIVKLSGLISKYYDDVNNNDDDSDVEVIDDCDCDIISTSARCSQTSDSDSDSDVKDSTERIALEEIEEPEDVYLNSFKNDNIDNSEIKLYSNKPIYQELLQDFISTSNSY